MIFTAIPAGTGLFLDANTLVYHFASDPTFGTACSELLKRIARREITGFTSTHVLTELAHRIMIAKAIAAFSWPLTGITRRLLRHPAQVQTLVRFRQAIQEIPQYGIQVLTIPVPVIEAAAAVSQQTGLLSNDALIVAVMRTHGLVNLASHDSAFDRVPGLTRFAPL